MGKLQTMSKIQLVLTFFAFTGAVTLLFLFLAFIENWIIRRNQKLQTQKKQA